VTCSQSGSCATKAEPNIGTRGSGTGVVPDANAHQERLCGTVRRECLDHVIIFNERHLYWILKEYVAWYNHGRLHQGIDRIPDAYPELKEKKPDNGKIVAIPVLNGLHHDYRLAA